MTRKIEFIIGLGILVLSCSHGKQSIDQQDNNIDDNKIGLRDSCVVMPDSVNLQFPERELDSYVIQRDTFNTLGRAVKYSKYKFFDTGLKGYPKLTYVDVFEFNDSSISVGSDGDFSKIITNAPNRFTIAQLHGNVLYNLDSKEGLKEALKLASESEYFPKARYEYSTIIEEMKEEQWISHFKKETVHTMLLLKNIDGYDVSIVFSTRIRTRKQTESTYGYYNSLDVSERLSKEESDSLSRESLKRLPPFLFRNWEEYAVPFYRYGYAHVYN